MSKSANFDPYLLSVCLVALWLQKHEVSWARHQGSSLNPPGKDYDGVCILRSGYLTLCTSSTLNPYENWRLEMDARLTFVLKMINKERQYQMRLCINCAVIKGFLHVPKCFPQTAGYLDLLTVSMYECRTPYFYYNLLHRNLISKKKKKHENVKSCMQLTADPQGTDFLNKRGTGRKEILWGRTRYAKHINVSFSETKSPCAL